MALYALQDVDDAVCVARDLLLPFDLRRWLKLVVIVLFVGGNSFSASINVGGLPERPANLPFPHVDQVLPLVVAAMVGIGLFALVYWGISAIMEFVFVESLRSGDVTIRKYWSDRWRQGLRLFGFRVVIFLPLGLLGLALMALFVLPLVGYVGGRPLLGLLVFMPIVAVVGFLVALINGLTTMFVVPIMINEDCRVLEGWRRLWASVTTDWKQYLAYVVVQFFLSIAVAIVVAIVVSIVAVIVLIPVGFVGFILSTTVGLTSTIGLVGLAVFGGVFGIFMLAASAFVQVPVQTFLRYYALLVLGDIEPEQDLIPERRSAARAE